MFRRCISFLVIAGLFVSQLAAVPHAHAGISAKDQQRHDATPHFHCHWHCHGEHAHGHSHAPGEQSQSTDGESQVNGVGGQHHNATAIFAPLQVSDAASTSHKGSVTSTSELAPLPTVDAADCWLSVCSTPRWHPPDKTQDASDTYLTLRNLRI